MGIKYSHCIDGNCIKDEQFTNKTSISEIILENPKTLSIEADEQVLSVNDDIVQRNSTHQLSNNSDSDSDQSVLSTISPTKPRRSSIDIDSISHINIVDNLYMTTLYIEDEIVDEWIELRDILQHGDPNKFLDYIKANPIPINNIRFTIKRYTPLHMAVYYSNFDMVKCLIQVGANINMKDEDGSTAVGLAYACVSTEILIYLLNIKAKEFLAEPNSPYAVSSIATSSVMSQNKKYPSLRKNSTDSRDSFDNISMLSEYEPISQYIYHSNDITSDKVIESRLRSKSLPDNSISYLSNTETENYSPSREIFSLQSPIMKKVSSISKVIKDTENSNNQIIDNDNINIKSDNDKSNSKDNNIQKDEIEIIEKKKTKKTFKNNLRKVAGRIIDFPFRPSKVPTTTNQSSNYNSNKIPIHSNIKTKVSFFENINNNSNNSISNKAEEVSLSVNTNKE